MKDGKLVKFSISILCCQNLDLTKKCIESIINADVKSSYELILTDNGSNDGTAEYIKDLSKKYKNIQIILNKQNLGFIEGHTIALKYANGRYFMILNNDSTVPNEWLDIILNEFITDKDVRIVGPHTAILNEEGMGIPVQQGEFDYIEGSCLTIPTDFARKIGLFADYLKFIYCEDAELCLRVRKLGYKIAHADFPFSHVRSAASILVKEDVMGYRAKNHIFFKYNNERFLKSRNLEEKILIYRKGAIGDVLLTTPIIREIKQNNVFARIGLVTLCPQLIQGNPYIEKIFHREDIGNIEYDKLIDLNLAYEKRPYMHIIDAYAEEAGIKVKDKTPEIYITEEDEKWVKKFFPNKYVIMHLGPTAWAGRNLPPHVMDIVAKKINKMGYEIVEIGHTGNLKYAVRQIIGQSFMRVAGMIKYCSAFIGIDSAPMQIAQVYNKPGVVTFGCINPEYRLLHPDILRPVVVEGLACIFCHHWIPGVNIYSNCPRLDPVCMTRITPEQIISEFEKALQNNEKIK